MPKSPFRIALTGQSLIKRNVLADRAPGFAALRAVLHEADVVFSNFEGTVVAARGWPTKGRFFGGTTAEMLGVLREIGVGLVSLANNHAFDFGPEGVLATIEAARTHGLVHAGTGPDLAAATRAASHRGVGLVAMDAGPAPDSSYAMDRGDEAAARPGLNRLRVSHTISLPAEAFAAVRGIEDALGFRALRPRYRPGEKARPASDVVEIQGAMFRQGDAIGRTSEIDEADMARNLAAIGAAAARGDRVIAYVHHHQWEAHWEQVPDWARRFARACIDAGAALYVSHGVPLLQGIELHRGRPILHGLGNFIFHTRHGPTSWALDEAWQSVVVTVVFDGSVPVRVELVPLVIGGEAALAAADFQAREVPHRAGPEMGRTILERLAARSAAFGTELRIENGLGVIAPLAA